MACAICSARQMVSSAVACAAVSWAARTSFSVGPPPRLSRLWFFLLSGTFQSSTRHRGWGFHLISLGLGPGPWPRGVRLFSGGAVPSVGGTRVFSGRPSVVFRFILFSLSLASRLFPGAGPSELRLLLLSPTRLPGRRPRCGRSLISSASAAMRAAISSAVGMCLSFMPVPSGLFFGSFCSHAGGEPGFLAGGPGDSRAVLSLGVLVEDFPCVFVLHGVSSWASAG